MTEPSPVSVALSKRLRAVKKKLNKADQIEQAVSSGKDINDDQREVLKTKPGCVAVIEELTKLESLLKEAMAEEINAAREKWEAAAAEKQAAQAPPTPPPVEVARGPNEAEMAVLKEKAVQEAVEQLIPLVYFSRMFEKSSKGLLEPNPMERDTCIKQLIQQEGIREAERFACRSWINQAGTEQLKEEDMDLIIDFGKLITCRPQGQIISHEMAIEQCCNAAKKLLLEAPAPMSDFLPQEAVQPTGTYIMDQVRKIKGSEYFTVKPINTEVAAGTEQQPGPLPGDDSGGMNSQAQLLPPATPDVSVDPALQQGSAGGSGSPSAPTSSDPTATGSLLPGANGAPPPPIMPPGSAGPAGHEQWPYAAMGMPGATAGMPPMALLEAQQHMASMPMGQISHATSGEGLLPNQQMPFGQAGMPMSFPGGFMMPQHASGMHPMMAPGPFPDPMFQGMPFMAPRGSGKMDGPPGMPTGDMKGGMMPGMGGPKDGSGDLSGQPNGSHNRQRSQGDRGNRGRGRGRATQGGQGGNNRPRNYDNRGGQGGGGGGRSGSGAGGGGNRNRQNQQGQQQQQLPSSGAPAAPAVV